SYFSASFNNPDVGTDKPVHVIGITIGGTDAGNYTFNTTADTTASILGNANTATTVTSDWSTINQTPSYGQAITFTATVTDDANAPTGSVEFWEGTIDLGHGSSLVASGNTATSTFTISTLDAGDHTITAVYT